MKRIHLLLPAFGLVSLGCVQGLPPQNPGSTVVHEPTAVVSGPSRKQDGPPERVQPKSSDHSAAKDWPQD